MGSGNTPARGKQWREGESSPATGNLSARPAGEPGPLFAKERLRRSLLRHCLVATAKYTERSVCVFEAWRNLSGPMWFQSQNQLRNQTPGRDRATSRWPAPSPGKRTRREDRALSHRPQMSSGRLFLDRVARQHGPSPLHRHGQTNTASLQPSSKQDISTLQRIGHFYFALTCRAASFAKARSPCRLRGDRGKPDGGCLCRARLGQRQADGLESVTCLL